MAEDLPTDFDLIVIGTGLTESVVAAAASRIGKSVLHVDSNDYYGGQWASFNLENIQKLFENVGQNKIVDKSEEESRTDVIALDPTDFSDIIKYAECNWFVESEAEEIAEDVNKLNLTENESSTENASDYNDEGKNSAASSEEVPQPKEEEKENEKEVKWTKNKILTEFRKFNIDFTPKLLFSRGDLVELLISSNICRYAEFRAVDRVTTLFEKQIKSVPCSRSDVFTNKNVNVVEKRLLMKILGNCLNYEHGCKEFLDFENKTFKEYLEQKRLTPSLIHYILYAISMSEDSTSCIEGIQNTKKFLNSLGRYGNTPFLFPMYGCGEIPQCFCRLCAVFGGVYCLKRAIEAIHLDKTNETPKATAIKCGEQVINGKSLVVGNSGNIKSTIFTDQPKEVSNGKKCGSLARSIYITNKPLGDEELNSGGGGVNILKLPNPDNVPRQAVDGAYVIQLSHHSGTCPKGLYLIHITCKGNSESPKSDVEIYEKQLFNEINRNTILCSFYFNIPACSNCQCKNKKLADNLFIACGPYFELDYDESIRQAKNLFTEIYPDEEFLPRAPDPEEIVIEDDHQLQNTDSVTETIINHANSEAEENVAVESTVEENKA